jgi:tetratricopeptide (TPR) repeat protein
LLYPEKLTLQRAAVIGRVFYDDAIAALDAADDNHVEDLTAVFYHLTEREFIFVRETTTFAGAKEYIFHGDMLREVLLSTLLDKQREIYNRASAEWLIGASGNRVDEYNGLIADYYEKAGEDELAAYYLQRAGEQALIISAYHQAKALFERSLGLLSNTADARCVLLLRLGETLYLMGNYPKARETLLKARLMTGGDTMRTADALYWLSQVYVIEGDYTQAQEFLEKSQSLSMSGQDRGTLARVLYGLGDLYWRQGNPANACDTLLKCLGMARQVEDSTLELNALNRLGTVYFDLNDMKNTQLYMEKTLKRAQEVGNREREASALNNLGEFTKGTDLEKALSYYKRALIISRDLERLQGIALLLANIAEGHIRLGEVAFARPLLHEGLLLARRVGAAPLTLILVQAAGLLFYEEGDQERGLALIGLSIYHPASLADLNRTANGLFSFLNIDRKQKQVSAGLSKGKELNLESEIPRLLDLLAPKG